MGNYRAAVNQFVNRKLSTTIGLTVSGGGFIEENLTYLSLFVFLGICSLADIKTQKIPNKYIAIGILEAVIISCIKLGPVAGLLDSLKKILIILMLFLPFYKYKKIGGGDIKMVMVMAALISVVPALTCFAVGIYICLVPLILQYIKHRKLKDFKLPMAPSILVGALLCYIKDGALN